MNTFLSPDVWPSIALSIAWWLLTLMPVFYAAFVAARIKPVLPRRLLFIGVTVALTYGTLVFLLFAIIIPLAGFTVYIAPQLEASGELSAIGRLAVDISFASYDWGFIVMPPFLIVSSIALTRYLAARWQQLVAGLRPNNSFKPNPLRGSA